MATISGCTIVRNTAKLNYPLEASIETYLPVCDEIVVAYDPHSEDDTENVVKDLAQKWPKIRLLASPWNTNNHVDGTEITIQSNLAVQACKSDWILYVQADEAIHENDYAAIHQIVSTEDAVGALFDRRSFLFSLDREIGDYFAPNLLRLFRRNEGFIVGDGMTAGLVQTHSGKVISCGLKMFNYSRMGSREEILTRARYRDRFHLDDETKIEENQRKEFQQSVRAFPESNHPRSLRSFYAPQMGTVTNTRFPVSLILLVGEGESQNSVSFWCQFRGWLGDVILLEDTSRDNSSEAMYRNASIIAGIPLNRIKRVAHAVNGDFAQARNMAHQIAQTPWVLHADPDELWPTALTQGIQHLVGQLDRDNKRICGFARTNFLDGVVVNDLPSIQWTERAISQHLTRYVWPLSAPV